MLVTKNNKYYKFNGKTFIKIKKTGKRFFYY